MVLFSLVFQYISAPKNSLGTYNCSNIMLIPEDFEAKLCSYQKKLVYFVYLKKLRSSLKYPKRTILEFLQCSVNNLHYIAFTFKSNYFQASILKLSLFSVQKGIFVS